MAVSKVVFGNNTIMDITDSTITADKVLEGEIAYAADGSRIVGTASGGGSISKEDLYISYLENSEWKIQNTSPNRGAAATTYRQFPAVDCAYSFSNNATFNSPIKIGNAVEDIFGILQGCNMYNQPVNIPRSVKWARGVFTNALNFNAHIEFEPPANNDDEIYLLQFLVNTPFNRPIALPDHAVVLSQALQGTAYLNAQVLFGKHSRNFYGVLNSKPSNVSVFNQPLILPKDSMAMSYLFNNTIFNQPILVLSENTYLLRNVEGNIPIAGNPAKCTRLDFSYMLPCYTSMGVKQFGSNIILASEHIFDGYNVENQSEVYVASMFGTAKDGTHRVNIYAHDLTPFLRTAVRQTVVNNAITWTATTNGYYNATYNIYLYNNVQQAWDWFNNYWHDFYGEYPDYSRY